MTFDTEHVRREIGRLRRLQQAVHKGRPFVLPQGAVTDLDQVERRLIEAVRRDLTGEPVKDGYPTGRLGVGGENAPQSRTEGAALAGYDDDGQPREPIHDPHHELTTAAVDALERAVQAIDVLMMKLDAIDRLATVHRTDPAGYCAACGRWVEGTAADRLRAGYCDACRKAWERAGRPDRPTFERQRQRDTAA